VQTDLDDGNPSVLLGAAGIPPIEMAEAYATIARQGARMPPRAIRYVTDDRGRTLRGASAAEPVQVFPQRDVYILTHVMQGVVDRGTAASARGLGFRKIAAGKTGTTNDKRDAWFIGFTPKTLALTWVGFDDNDPTGLSGSDAAVPMWARYMIAVTAGEGNPDFVPPPGITFTEFDKTTGGLATAFCPRNVIVSGAFKSGTEPSVPCQPHSAPQSSTVVPMYDEFGNLIITDAATMTDTMGSIPPLPPDSTLTGGVFQPQPSPIPVPPPPTTTTEEPPPEEPPPATDTSTTTSGVR
jgi:membrane carboxypeptidase/penicillin-binding protein